MDNNNRFRSEDTEALDKGSQCTQHNSQEQIILDTNLLYKNAMQFSANSTNEIICISADHLLCRRFAIDFKHKTRLPPFLYRFRIKHYRKCGTMTEVDHCTYTNRQTDNHVVKSSQSVDSQSLFPT